MTSVMQRGVLRTGFTKACNSLDDLLKDGSRASLEDIQVAFQIVQNKHKQLKKQDEQILATLKTETDFENEYAGIDAYDDRYHLLSVKTGLRTAPKGQPAVSATTTTANSNGYKGLPKVEFKKFDGQPQNWLPFWNQFYNKVHKNKSLPDEDKFQYLQQSMVEGSPAAQCVDAFPLSKANYPIVVDALKQRFAQDEWLVEYYIRELLKLVFFQRSQNSTQLSLANLVDKLEFQLKNLETLGVSHSKYEAILFPMVESALPRNILELWNRAKASTTSQSAAATVSQGGTSPQVSHLTNLMKFLKAEVTGQERMKLAQDMVSNNVPTESQETLASAASLVNQSQVTGQEGRSNNTSNKDACIFCERKHPSSECVKAQRMTLKERKDCVKIKKVCFACLHAHSRRTRCTATVRCLVCGKKHYAILCPQIKPPESTPTTSQDTPSNSIASANIGTLPVITYVYVQSLRVKVFDAAGISYVIRAVYDSLSQLSYATESCLAKLQLPSKGTAYIAHHLFGGKEVKEKHNVFSIQVGNLNSNYKISLQVLSERTICREIEPITDQKILDELNARGIIVSDTGPSSPIDLLIGADFEGLLRTGRLVHLPQGPTAVETQLGWTLLGRAQRHVLAPVDNLCNQGLLEMQENFLPVNSLCNYNLPDLWELERIGIQDPIETRTKEKLEAEAMQFFSQNIRLEQGRYNVKMPWLTNHPPLQSNYGIAIQRLKTTTEKLQKTGYYNDYDAVFKEWESLNIIERVQQEDIQHFLPHRPVIREQAQKTKIRPVFDASAKPRHGHSLNDCVAAGPNMIEKIPSILTQFRLYPFGVAADIRKAFLQLSLDEEDRQFLGFLWWTDSTRQDLIYYRHCRVVFGVRCSPFLLNASIRTHLNSPAVPQEFQKTANQLRGSFYVDDCLHSLQTKEKLQQFISDSKKIMGLGGFELTSWKYTGMQGEDVAYSTVLGLPWYFETDLLACIVPFSQEEFQSQVITKRILLSMANRIFDPLGFISPATLPLKIWLQHAWKEGADWDSPLTDEIQADVQKWLRNINHLQNFRIPRCINFTTVKESSLHVFSDASAQAFGSVIYLRTETPSITSVRFVMAKARVAPIPKVKKSTTSLKDIDPRSNIPRLELTAAYVGVRLIDNLRSSFPENIPVTYWSDSEIALHWIQGNGKWSTFVNNRVSDILKFSTRNQWRHVPGILNPADLPSRGCDGQFLTASDWWNGPSFLFLPQEQWPTNKITCKNEDLQHERRPEVINLVNIQPTVDYSEWFESSSYSNILYSIARVRNLANTVISKRNKDGSMNKNKILLTPVLGATKLERIKNNRPKFSDIRQVENDLIKWAQASINLGQLDMPYIDLNGIICIKTKTVALKDMEVSNRPMLLPHNHIFTQRLIEEQHRNLGHAGVATVWTTLRKRFWILKGRQTVRKYVTGCMRCKRFTAKAVLTPPAALPPTRIMPVAVFQFSGVDYAGPLHLRHSQNESKKAWICLFTCAVYRSLHLELVTSLTTDKFLQAFRRFIARRGKPKVMHSDHGTNFEGADNLLAHLDWARIEKETGAQPNPIEWKFIPPKAPWMGGFWERMVRTVKDLLKRNLGRALLDYEELSTVLCDVESVINSRPLTYVSNDSNEYEPLTPNDFLIAIKGNEVTDLNEVEANHFKERIRYVQEIRASLISRFQKEYLANLVHYGNTKVRAATVKVGDIVLVSDDTKKRISWPLAKIIEVYPGNDGVIRKVRLRLNKKQGELIRPVQKIYPLELNENEGKALIKSCQLVDEKFDAEVSPTHPIQVDSILESSDRTDVAARFTVPSDSHVVTRSGRVVKATPKLNLTNSIKFPLHIFSGQGLYF